ncbi:uncharacterized protein A1O5_07526 [Cladophialophora psammophila CBS 110553]|uniref:Heterokaryon incompatibility domain-containing protein n=1 Tax=Cladophialophora psammophila CBS 110553 TaxID=1182543 RepID=W9WWR3_9EURO|nr:uncharacterized protein A1O5_07526 [Cladophialophora psammophila CBS 110553]EXJ69490.1 hypothetical protein A1O5_07526 [Cladophialophora psammophila CBS 110553]
MNNEGHGFWRRRRSLTKLPDSMGGSYIPTPVPQQLPREKKDDFASVAGKTYEYTALEPDEIRLMVLHRGPTGPYSHRDQELQCSLETLALNNAQATGYEALSYVWSAGNLYGYTAQLYPEEVGRPNRRALAPHECRIWCQHDKDAKKSGFRAVTSNLIEALSRLRNASEDRILWVDAICINQDNEDAEKAAQVPLMATIYSCASRVLIWLGETLSRPIMDVSLNRPDITDSAFDYITWVNELKPGERNLNYYLDTKPSIFFSQIMPSWGMFQEFLARCVWFQRTWTFQEAVMAEQATVICGGRQACWDALYQACSFQARGMEENSGLVHRGKNVEAMKFVLEIQCLRKRRPSSVNTEKECLTDADPWRLDRLLCTTRSKGVTCLHDKVYAVLSMASGPDLPLPDYNTSPTKVYGDVARYLARNLDGGWTSVLSYVELSHRYIVEELRGLPSWVPDWSFPTDAASVSLYANFRAAGVSVSQCFVLENKDGNQDRPLLSIRGVRLFTVDRVAKASHEDENEPIDMPWAIIENYPLKANESYLEAYSKVVRPDTVDLGDPQEDLFWTQPPPFWENLEKWTARQSGRAGCGYFYSWATLSGPRFYSHLPQMAPKTSLRAGFTPIHNGRRLFLGSSGCLGLAPLATRKGDHVCLLLGGDVLYVIRPALNGRFTFVGECFVYGLMHGEAMESLPEDRVEDFVLE